MKQKYPQTTYLKDYTPPPFLVDKVDLEIDLGEDITTCEESVTLDAGEGYDSYSWSTGEDSQTITIIENAGFRMISKHQICQDPVKGSELANYIFSK